MPRAADTREITRFCLARRLRPSERLTVRNRLVSALVEHALGAGISTYTGVAELPWFQQILAFGWDCFPLGQALDGLAAMRINITEETTDHLHRAGIYAPTLLVDLDRAAA